MSADIAARIRERLDLNGHEDWCPAVIHKSCCDGQCECATGGLVDTLHAVLDMHRPKNDGPFSLVDYVHCSCGQMVTRSDGDGISIAPADYPCETVLTIAEKLGIPTDSPARDDTTSTVAGSRPSRAGVPTEDGVS